LPVVFVSIQLITSEPMHAIQYKFIVVNGLTTTSAVHFTR